MRDTLFVRVAYCVWAAGSALTCSAQAVLDPPLLFQVIRIPSDATLEYRRYSSITGGPNVVGMASLTGEPETWLFEAHASFASVEALDRALNTGARPAGENRLVLAIYRSNLSRRPAEAMKLFTKARYFVATLTQFSSVTAASSPVPGHNRFASYDFIGSDQPELTYQIIAGAASGGFLCLTPLTSLKSIDDWITQTGSPLTESFHEHETSREHFLLRVEPRLSLVSDDFASNDPDFWRSNR
jgi:hypothetical protein